MQCLISTVLWVPLPNSFLFLGVTLLLHPHITRISLPYLTLLRRNGAFLLPKVRGRGFRWWFESALSVPVGSERARVCNQL